MPDGKKLKLTIPNGHLGQKSIDIFQKAYYKISGQDRSYRPAFGDRSAEERKMIRQVGSRRRLRWPVDRAVVEIEFRSVDQARALARGARSERLHQDRVGTVGPEPIVEEDDHPESERTSTEGACRGPSDFPWRKDDAVEAPDAKNLY